MSMYASQCFFYSNLSVIITEIRYDPFVAFEDDHIVEAINDMTLMT